MWIETRIQNQELMFNSDLIECIGTINNEFVINFTAPDQRLEISFETSVEAMAYYKGFKMALNGLDVKLGNKDFIKPLFSCKNKVLYEYMMLKELEGDRLK